MKTAVITNIKQTAPETWEDALSRFVAWRKAQGAAPRTIQGYKEKVSLFFKRFPFAWSGRCRDSIMLFLSQEGISPATYNARLKVLHPFFRFCVYEGVFDRSPAEGMKYRREEARIVDHPISEIKKLLSVIREDTFPGLRDKALFLFSLDTGTRPGEALQLRPSDIDCRTGKAVIRAAISKTRIGRNVFFTPATSRAIQQVISIRPEEWEKDTPVFCTSYGSPWNSRGWTGQLSRYARKAGIQRFSSYDIRHLHAIQYLRNGGDVFTLQKGMGHNNLSMTRKYLALSDDDLRIAHEKASPVLALFSTPRKRLGKIGN